MNAKKRHSPIPKVRKIKKITWNICRYYIGLISRIKSAPNAFSQAQTNPKQNLPIIKATKLGIHVIPQKIMDIIKQTKTTSLKINIYITFC